MQDDQLLIAFLFVLLLAVDTPWFLFLLAFLRRRMARRIATGLAVVLTVVPLLLLALGGAILLFLHYSQREFTPDYWAGHEMERYIMRQDLIQSRRLIGLSPAQVQQMLGAPATEYRSAETELLYTIGYPPSLTTMDRPDVLVIRFRDGKVAHVQ